MTNPLREWPVDVTGAAKHGADVPELKVGSADATYSANFSNNSERDVARGPFAPLQGLLLYASRLLWAALLYGSAGLAGWFVSDLAWPLYAVLPDLLRANATQESVERDALLRTTQKMEEEIRALRTDMDAMRSSFKVATPDNSAIETLNKRVDAIKMETGSAIGELSSQVEHLQRDAVAKPVQGGERSDQTERRAAEPIAPRSISVSAAVKVGGKYKHARTRRGDAFEPSKHPDAPGAPRPLGGPFYQ